MVADYFLKKGIDKLFFTGSVAVGKQLMGEAGETLTPLVLELGGNDAMLVCEDADLHRAASGAVCVARPRATAYAAMAGPCAGQPDGSGLV